MSHCSSEVSTNTQQDVVEEHLNWTWKQGRILTHNGKANDFFIAERAYPFDKTELPHYYLLKQTTHSTFDQWIKEQQQQQRCTTTGDVAKPSSHSTKSRNDVVCGAWKRLLFVGGFEHVSSSDKEYCWNLQSSCGYFIDLRIPKSRERLLSSRGVTCLQDYTSKELRLFARQHVFGGFTKIDKALPSDNRRYDIVCTRHHCMDWNFIGVGRPRPNKWYVEPTTTNKVGRMFKEWSYATDDHGQSYYFETWQDSYNGNDNGVVLALRKAPSSTSSSSQREDGLLIVVGTHFNYLLGRHHGWQTLVREIWNLLPCDKKPTSLVDLVDAALGSSNTVSRSLVEQLLDMDAGHGRILLPSSSSSSSNNQWKIDCAIQPWKEGICLFSCDRKEATLMVPIRTSTTSSMIDDDQNCCYLMWNKERWNVYECRGMDCRPETLAKYFGIPLQYYYDNVIVDAAPTTRSKL